MKVRRLAAVVLSLLSVSLTAAAQSSDTNRWERQVRDLLRNSRERLEARGYRQTETVTGSLDDGGSRTVTVYLESTARHEVRGVCDFDCDDLDLELTDGSRTLDSDYEDDDFPILTVDPPRVGRYQIKVSMADCSESPCWYAIGVFELRSGR